jgi:hypothetical protein
MSGQDACKDARSAQAGAITSEISLASVPRIQSPKKKNLRLPSDIIRTLPTHIIHRSLVLFSAPSEVVPNSEENRNPVYQGLHSMLVDGKLLSGG